MNLSSLSDAELVDKLEVLSRDERAMTVNVLEHLIELEKRGLYRDLGYPSLFVYCTKVLKYSQASAYRRIAAARVLKDNPEVKELLKEGKLTLCSVTTAAKSIQNKVTKVEEIVGCSKREVQEIVAKTEPVERKPQESIMPVLLKPKETPLFAVPEGERVQLRFSLSKEEYQRLEAARAQFSNSIGKELTLEGLVGKLLDQASKVKERKAKASNPDSRYIPRSVKRELLRKHNGQCCYQSPDGVQCSARNYLQVDHIVPFACGGKTELSNLRLLCPTHNKLMAERYFGKQFIQTCTDYHR